MNQQEHKTEAERLLEIVAKIESEFEGKLLPPAAVANLSQSMDRGIACAQVHATLATVQDQ